MTKDTDKAPIKTFIRIKPSSFPITNISCSKESLTLTKSSGESLQYTLDHIFDSNASQLSIFKHLSPILKNTVKGINSTVFCYGNTGSGKTYTMFGTKSNPGIVHNFVSSMFNYFNTIKELFDIQVLFSYFQIYNEKVFDMFNNSELILRECKDGIIINNLTEKQLFNKNDFETYFEIATKNRKIGSTKYNQFSSRSHTILRLDCVVDNVRSHIYLIDLAGSENNKKTGNEGLRLLESTNINKSLFVLNQVVNAILNKSLSIPYRDSKLTRVLKDSLGGNSVCYIFGCIEMDQIEETQRTLEFVSKSRRIVCEVKSKLGRYINEKREIVFDRVKKQNNTTYNGTNNYNIKINNLHKGTIEIKNNNLTKGENNLNMKNNLHGRKSFLTNHDINILSKGENNPNIKNNFYLKVNDYEPFKKKIGNRRILGEKNINTNNYECKKNIDKKLSNFEEAVNNSNSNRYLKGDFEGKLNIFKKVKPKGNFDDKLYVVKKVKSDSLNEGEFYVDKKIKFAKDEKKAVFFSEEEILKMINSDNFIDIKKINGIGDKRASVLIEYIRKNGKITKLEQLKMVFSEKVYDKITKSFL